MFREPARGYSAAERVHLLASLERPSERWVSDRESAEQSLSAAISLLLRLVGRRGSGAQPGARASVRLRAAPTLVP